MKGNGCSSGCKLEKLESCGETGTKDAVEHGQEVWLKINKLRLTHGSYTKTVPEQAVETVVAGCEAREIPLAFILY